MTTADFDLQSLFHAIDSERQRQQLSWSALSRHVNVAASTIRRYAEANDAEADGVLTLVQWLDAAPEDFVACTAATPRRLAPAEEGQVRVDMELVAEAAGDLRGADGRTRTTIQRLVNAARKSNRSIASLTLVTNI